MLMQLYGGFLTLLLVLSGVRRRRLEAAPISLGYLHRRRRTPPGETPREPWIFLHGLAGVAAVTWWPEFFALRGGGDLLALDLGETGGTRAPGGALTIRQGAEMVIRLLDKELAGRAATVVGLSLGGWIAVRVALERPDLVARLVLVDAAGFRDQDWDRISSLVTLKKMADVEPLYRALFAHPPWFMRWSRKAFFDAFTSAGVRTILRETAEADTYNRRDLHHLAMPVELVWGEHDGLFRLEVAESMQQAVAGSRLQVLPGCGHAVHIECPRALTRALREIRRTPVAAVPRRSSTTGKEGTNVQP